MKKERSVKSTGVMWRSGVVACLAIALVLIVAPRSSVADDHGSYSLASINWMLGTWSRDSRRGLAVEEWHQVDDAVFLGEGRAVGDGGESRLIEKLMLVELNGEVFYFAKVAENPYPTPFRLVSATESTAVFENPEHDFPKRLEYRLEDGTMSVQVTGEDDQGFTLQFSQNNP